MLLRAKLSLTISHFQNNTAVTATIIRGHHFPLPLNGSNQMNHGQEFSRNDKFSEKWDIQIRGACYR